MRKGKEGLVNAHEAELRLVERLVEELVRRARTELPQMENVSLDKTRGMVAFSMAGVDLEMTAREFLSVYATEPIVRKGGA
jgi:hypothetical protein